MQKLSILQGLAMPNYPAFSQSFKEVDPPVSTRPNLSCFGALYAGQQSRGTKRCHEDIDGDDKVPDSPTWAPLSPPLTPISQMPSCFSSFEPTFSDPFILDGGRCKRARLEEEEEPSSTNEPLKIRIRIPTAMSARLAAGRARRLPAAAAMTPVVRSTKVYAGLPYRRPRSVPRFGSNVVLDADEPKSGPQPERLVLCFPNLKNVNQSMTPETHFEKVFIRIRVPDHMRRNQG